jgi:hypothetical protein
MAFAHGQLAGNFSLWAAAAADQLPGPMQNPVMQSFGSARARSLFKAMSRSQDSKAAAIRDVASHEELIANHARGTGGSFPVRMQSPTLACTRWAASMSPAGPASPAARRHIRYPE